MAHRWRLCILLLLLAMAGCATRAPLSDFDRPASHALAADTQGPLGQSVTAAAATHADQSGFYLLVHGQEAFEARLALIQQARTSLDLQYYTALQDHTGTVILNALAAAARRGVRVRLLLDDLNLDKPDGMLAIMAVQPNFEVRVFNPLTTGGRSMFARAGALIADYDHLERRMHNKSLIADGVLAIVGGRNLADQYFDARPDMNFRDLDVLAAGQLPGKLGTTFDHYWNSKESYPLPALEPRPPSQEAITGWQNGGNAPPPPADKKEPAQMPVPDAASANAFLGKATRNLIWAQAWLAADNPDKVEADADAQTGSKPGKGLLLAAQLAQHEFIIMSAYFVPRDGGTQFLGQMEQRGVAVKVLTNSLASTDVAAVHSAWRKYRKALIASGVEVHEFRPVAGVHGAALSTGSSRASLHTKAYVVDRQILMIGSFNLDPRSVNLNTEQAVLIKNPELAQQVAYLYDQAATPKYSYKLELAPPRRPDDTPQSRQLRWIGQEDGKDETWTSEPGAGLWRRTLSGVVGLFPADDEL
ncbi:putative cardiolipin synthase [Silvimonas terrae]|uniref:Putative cardiolipin synthase n=1 Tax=Silvimonas terrae TaxID=300266 RepID=A0A840RHJ9_9NEIS|nr:phospholipase D family protein [Silvimonas terrae]MBB5192557.1 putative cardiolipin synthase [Silvimonas terrae]